MLTSASRPLLPPAGVNEASRGTKSGRRHPAGVITAGPPTPNTGARTGNDDSQVT